MPWPLRSAAAVCSASIPVYAQKRRDLYRVQLAAPTLRVALRSKTRCAALQHEIGRAAPTRLMCELWACHCVCAHARTHASPVPVSADSGVEARARVPVRRRLVGTLCGGAMGVSIGTEVVTGEYPRYAAA